jgi:hypothetical protein
MNQTHGRRDKNYLGRNLVLHCQNYSWLDNQKLV